MRDLASCAGPVSFVAFCQDIEAANWIFSAVDGFEGAHSEFHFRPTQFRDQFTLSVNIGHAIEARKEWINYPELEAHRSLLEIISQLPDLDSEIKDNVIAQQALMHRHSRQDFLHYFASIAYGGDNLPLATDDQALRKYGLVGVKFITINNGFDAGLVISGRTATKCYPHGEELVRQFKAAFPNVLVVQVGSKNSIALHSVDKCLIGQTSLIEAATILKSSQLHIDNEGGLVHVATSVGTRCCVLFGPTPVEYFAYGSNINIAPEFCGNCWWSTKSWMDICPRGFETATCLSSRDPLDILKHIATKLPEAFRH